MGYEKRRENIEKRRMSTMRREIENDIERKGDAAHLKKLIFHRIERFILPGIFVGSLRALVLVHDLMRNLPVLEIATTASREDKKDEFAVADKLRRKRRHVSPAISLHIRRDMFFPVTFSHFSSPLPSPLSSSTTVLVTSYPYGFTSFLLLFIAPFVNPTFLKNYRPRN